MLKNLPPPKTLHPRKMNELSRPHKSKSEVYFPHSEKPPTASGRSRCAREFLRGTRSSAECALAVGVSDRRAQRVIRLRLNVRALRARFGQRQAAKDGVAQRGLREQKPGQRSKFI